MATDGIEVCVLSEVAIHPQNPLRGFEESALKGDYKISFSLQKKNNALCHSETGKF